CSSSAGWLEERSGQRLSWLPTARERARCREDRTARVDRADRMGTAPSPVGNPTAAEFPADNPTGERRVGSRTGCPGLRVGTPQRVPAPTEQPRTVQPRTERLRT